MKRERERRSSDTASLAWAREAGLAQSICSDVAIEVRRRQRRRQRAAVGAACGLCLAAGFAYFGTRGRVAPESTTIAASTIVSAPTRQQLADGSTVELSESARAVVDFSETSRRVSLQGGQAHFVVAKDPARPFIVAVQGIEVRAVGTEFSIHLDTRAVEVLVTEGRVAVVAQGAGPNDHPRPGSNVEVFVDAGHLVTVGMANAVQSFVAEPTAVTPADVAQRLAWRIPRLRLSGTSLEEAVPRFNEHSREQLVLGDENVRKLRLSGVLRADNADALLELLQAEFGVTAEWRGEREIVLRRPQ